MILPQSLLDEIAYINRVSSEIFKESDRSVGVLLGAELDVLLEKLLHHALLPKNKKSNPLLEHDGPLATFSSRIELCYRMGLISEDWHHDLQTIRKIRNEFAHGLLGTDFSTQKIRDLLISA